MWKTILKGLIALLPTILTLLTEKEDKKKKEKNLQVQNPTPSQPKPDEKPKENSCSTPDFEEQAIGL